MTFTSITLDPGASPEIGAAYRAVWEALWRQGHLPVTALELARLRLAALHQAQDEMALRPPWAAELSKEKVAAALAGHWPRDPAFSAAERAILAFTEVYAQDPEAIGDELAADVKAHFGEAGLVCLVEALGFIDGRLRLTLLFNHLGAAR
jgi:alkylhydroperoxidase family enzyme